MNRKMSSGVSLTAKTCAALVCMAASAWADDPIAFPGEKDQGLRIDAPAGATQSFACWVKVIGRGAGDKPYDRIVQTPDWYLHIVAAQDEVTDVTFGYIGRDGSVVSNGYFCDLAFGAWQHVAVTYAQDGFRVYVNGVCATGAMSEKLPALLKGGPSCLGNVSPGGNRPLKGCLATARFWQRKLSEDELRDIAALAPDGKPPLRRISAGPASGDVLPVVDISAEVWRQTVIAEGATDRYEGHPTTLLSDDGKTLFCVWTTGHGGPCGPMARSDDGGRTWRRIDAIMPAVYARTHRNCPVLQKFKGPDGRVRYFIYSAKAKEGRGLGIMMSEDLGETWMELPCQTHLSSGMPPTGAMVLKNGDVALFGQVFKDAARAKDHPSDDQAVWMAISRDGGLTFGMPRVVMQASLRNLCEPCCLRSPDGKSLLLLARENRHKGRSMMCFSGDEGRTWTEPVDTPWALTGDRHEGILLPDGRYVIAFRDRAIGSPTLGQYMAWVGSFDDLRQGRNGSYRIHLLQHHGMPSWDTGYSGVELLKDGTIVCTTYTRHFDDDRQSSVVSTHFKIAETDGMAEKERRSRRELRLSLEDYRDKMAGAWLGQSVGVGYGWPTEFRWRGTPIPETALPIWTPETVNETFTQDDLYVEMTFLRTLATRGLNVGCREAGIDFANSRYRLWCGNFHGRNNVRRGIAAPDSSHPKYHPSTDDLDYQIESDFSGILSPGMPQAAIAFGNVFGRIMNYGDGLYAGQFIGGMYAAAYFTNDRLAVVAAGLRCIPEKSKYAGMVRDVVEWYLSAPEDWLGSWEKAVAKYGRKDSPELGRCSEPWIDVKINGAIVLLGYLYGQGDIDRTLRLTTRGGYDSDCNPSTACGVLFTSLGEKAVPVRYKEKLDRAKKWEYTEYDWTKLLAVTEKLTCELVVREGGRIERDAKGRETLVIPWREPQPNALETGSAPGPVANARLSRAEQDEVRYAVCEEMGALSERKDAPDRRKNPVRIIFDSDMLTDFDDVGALACLHAFADKGECEIAATVSSSRGNASVGVLEVVNAWYGRPQLPVGAPKDIGFRGDGDGFAGGHGKYRRLLADYPQFVRTPDSDNAPDSNHVLRKALAESPDGSVVICTVGFLTNVRRLLETSADEISPLNGRELLARKVQRWVVTGFRYPSGKEFNAKTDAESSAIALTLWPKSVPIFFTDFEYGRDVYSGRRLVESDAKGPVKDVFAAGMIPREKCGPGTIDVADGHPSWDETAAFLAVYGVEPIFGFEHGIYSISGDTGVDEWHPDDAIPGGRVVEDLPKVEFGRIIDEMLFHRAKGQTKANKTGTGH